MIAISSIRALSDSMEVATNQIRAHQSWQRVFDAILYFGAPEPLLTCPRTSFIESEDFPFISALATAASMCSDWACLINADIVVSPAILSAIFEVQKKGGNSCMSLRYEFTGDNWDMGQIVDNGLDFFAAEPWLWRKFSNSVPAHYRLGHSSWDTWAMGFFNTVCPRNFYDISRRQCVFHPKHGDRKRAHEIKPVDDIYTILCGMPLLKL